MAFVHRQSCEGVKSELDIFAVPPTQTSIEDGRWVEHQPLSSLDSGGPIEFVIPGTGDAYLDLANTYLLIRAKVVRGVGTDLAADTPVAPVNNWLHSPFSQVDVYLNDTLVTPSSNTYPFRAYVDTVLSYGAEAKNTQLTSQLWYKDTAGHMDAKDTLPEVVSTYPSAFVCNTHDSDQPGEHWVAMYVDEIGDYFDPYGQKPQHAEFTNFMNEHCSQWSSNDHILQSPISTVCGQYCVAFLMFRCLNISMHAFARLFTSDLIANDCRVYDWLGALSKK